MKFKKLISSILTVAVAGVFATTAFAATDSELASQATEKLAGYGITYTVTESDIQSAKAAGYTVETLTAKADELVALAKTDPNAAAEQANNLASSIGVDFKVSVVNGSNGSVSLAATVNGASVGQKEVVAGSTNSADNNKNDSKDEAVSESTEAAATALTSNTSVIKATGDNSAVVLLAGVLGIAAVVGVAIRKSILN